MKTCRPAVLTLLRSAPAGAATSSSRAGAAARERSVLKTFAYRSATPSYSTLKASSASVGSI